MKSELFKLIAAVGLLGNLSVLATPVFATPTYAIDDGSGETGATFFSGSVTWFNQFSVTNGDDLIESVEIALGFEVFVDPLSSSPNGSPIIIKLWDDVNNDGSPDDALELVSFVSTVANWGTDIFNIFDIPDTLVSGSFFVGAEIASNIGFSARSDVDTLLGQSWISNSGGQSAVASSNGTWLIRATGSRGRIPEPTTLLLLGVGLMGVSAFRKKRA